MSEEVGYLNHIDYSDGRVIRTIIVDPDRAPFVKLGFELFATGDYSQEDLCDELYERARGVLAVAPVPGGGSSNGLVELPA